MKSKNEFNSGERWKMTKRLIVPVLLACCLFSLAAYGDDFSRFEVFGVYSFMRFTYHEAPVILAQDSSFTMSTSAVSIGRNLNGMKAGVVFNLNRYLGIAGEFGWNQSPNSSFQPLLVAADTVCYPGQCYGYQSITLGPGARAVKNYTFLAGPRLSMNLVKRLRPYAQVLIGLNRNDLSESRRYNIALNPPPLPMVGAPSYVYDVNVSVAPEKDNAFAIAAGGGLDLKINKRFSVRLFEMDVVNVQKISRQYTVNVQVTRRFPYPPGREITDRPAATFAYPADGWTSNMRFSFGAVFHFCNKQGCVYVDHPLIPGSV
jgi:opacity protein-like surface antigen